jgi:hypothetical protein
MFDELLPERGDIDDRDRPHLAEAQEVGVGAHQVVGPAGYRAVEEFVVRGIPAHADRDFWADQDGATPDPKERRARLAGRDAELAHDIRARGDHVELGENRLGDEQDELVGAPRFVDAGGEALGPGEGAPQQDLSVKNGLERGQRGPPRR